MTNQIQSSNVKFILLLMFVSLVETASAHQSRYRVNLIGRRIPFLLLLMLNYYFVTSKYSMKSSICQGLLAEILNNKF